MPIEAVLFDLDNTLINRRLAFRTYADRFVDRFVHVADEADREKIVATIIEADRDGYRGKRELFHELRTGLALKEKKTTAEQMLEFWFAEFCKCTVLMEGALDILDHVKARGVKLGLITNGSVRGQNAKINEAGIRHYFDAIVISDEAGVKKPDRQIFGLALERLGTAADKAIFIGDHPVNDVKGATDAGLRGIWLKGFMDRRGEDDAPRYAIDRLSELAELLESFAI